MDEYLNVITTFSLLYMFSIYKIYIHMKLFESATFENSCTSASALEHVYIQLMK